MQGHKLKKVQEFKYLGSTIRAIEDLTRKLQIEYKQVGMLGERLQAYCVIEKCQSS